MWFCRKTTTQSINQSINQVTYAEGECVYCAKQRVGLYAPTDIAATTQLKSSELLYVSVKL